jgi:endonuclease YncB( thermonuclease family)
VPDRIRSALIFLALAIVGIAPAEAQSFAGQASVVDGDTIEIGHTRIRLWGIDAPELKQTCQGRGGDVYECGRDAAAELRALTSGRRVECDQRDRDRYGRVVAICRTDAGEINAGMVRQGWAIDYRRYSGRAYDAEERAASAERLGMWSGRFELPERWRREHPR